MVTNSCALIAVARRDTARQMEFSWCTFQDLQLLIFQNINVWRQYRAHILHTRTRTHICKVQYRAISHNSHFKRQSLELTPCTKSLFRNYKSLVHSRIVFCFYGARNFISIFTWPHSLFLLWKSVENPELDAMFSWRCCTVPISGSVKVTLQEATKGLEGE
jgi:hypothetical protein